MRKLFTVLLVVVVLGSTACLGVSWCRSTIEFGKTRANLMTEVRKEVYGEYLDGFFTGRDLTGHCFQIVRPLLGSHDEADYLRRLESMTRLRTENRQNAGYHVGDSYKRITSDTVGELYKVYFQTNPRHGADKAEEWLASEESGMSVQYEHLRKLSKIHSRLDRIYWELMTCEDMEELKIIETEYRSLLADYEAEMAKKVPRVSIKQNG